PKRERNAGWPADSKRLPSRQRAWIMLPGSDVARTDVPVQQPALQVRLLRSIRPRAVHVMQFPGILRQVVQLALAVRPEYQFGVQCPDHRGPCDRLRMFVLQLDLGIVDVFGTAEVLHGLETLRLIRVVSALAECGALRVARLAAELRS